MADLKTRYLIEAYSNGSSWYRKYSDGWVEQGSRIKGDNATVALLVPMKNTSYSVTFGMLADSGSRVQGAWAYSLGTTSFRVGMGTYSGSTSQWTSWEVKGFA